MVMAELWLLQSEGADCTAPVQEMLSLVRSTGSRHSFPGTRTGSVIHLARVTAHSPFQCWPCTFVLGLGCGPAQFSLLSCLMAGINIKQSLFALYGGCALAAAQLLAHSSGMGERIQSVRVRKCMG